MPTRRLLNYFSSEAVSLTNIEGKTRARHLRSGEKCRTHELEAINFYLCWVFQYTSCFMRKNISLLPFCILYEIFNPKPIQTCCTFVFTDWVSEGVGRGLICSHSSTNKTLKLWQWNFVSMMMSHDGEICHDFWTAAILEFSISLRVKKSIKTDWE